MVKREVVSAAAILAGESIAEKNIKAREGWPAGSFDVCLEGNDGRQPHLERGAANRTLIYGDDIHTLKAYSFDSVLPRPQRQGVIAQRSEVSVQHERWAALRRYLRLEVNRQIGHPSIAGSGRQPASRLYLYA